LLGSYPPKADVGSSPTPATNKIRTGKGFLLGSYPPKVDVGSSPTPATNKIRTGNGFLLGSYPPKADVGSSPTPATNRKLDIGSNLNLIFIKSGLCISGFFMLRAMYSVYVLYSGKYDKIYIGFTSHLEARLESHNTLASKGYTIRYRPWELIYTEKYEKKSEALLREKQLKSGQGRVFIRSLIKKL
jgi:putative endonuclease